jgi:hypothetical protein
MVSNHRESVRFLVVAGDVGQQFVGGNADGNSQFSLGQTQNQIFE